MYAIIEDGSRQYRAEVGKTFLIDYRNVEQGTSIELDHVLLYQNAGETLIGSPLVAGAKVVAKVVEHAATKTMIQKFRRRKNYRRLTGHSQPFIRVKVEQILRSGEQAPAAQSTEAPAH